MVQNSNNSLNQRVEDFEKVIHDLKESMSMNARVDQIHEKSEFAN